MEHTSNAKHKRPYDISRRQEQARRNRNRIVDAAERRFLGDGYGLTTIAAIVGDAGVSADTIYKSFGGKPGLVRAIHAVGPRRCGPGAGRAAIGTRCTTMHAILARSSRPGAPSPLKLRPGSHRSCSSSAPRPATDPEVAALLDEMDRDRGRRMTENARRLQRAGHLRPGISIARAADVLWTYSAPELYELLVLRRGWPLRRYGRFVADAMIDALL